MPDIQRTQTDLLTTLFQDGQTAGISAQDLRDLIVSLSPPHGSVKMEANATATAIAVTSTFYPVAGTFVAEGSPRFFTEAADGKLTYTGVADRLFLLHASLAFTGSGGSQDVDFGFGKNGVIVPPAMRTNTSGTNLDTISVLDVVSLSQNDYVELMCANESGLNDITVSDARLVALGVIL